MDNRVSQLSQPIILLSRGDLAGLMPFGAYVESVAEAFRLHAQGRTVLPALMHVPTEAGGFYVETGGPPTGYVGFQANANFPNNCATKGPPTIPGPRPLLNRQTRPP